MAQDKLSVTITFNEDHFEVTATMVETNVLPAAMFLYENDGTTTLGPYYGVANLSEIQSRQIFTGTSIPVFGNRYVRYTQAFLSVPTMDDAQLSKQLIITHVQNLKNEVLSQQPDTQIVVI